MKRKVLLLILVLFLILALVGCGNKEAIKEVIDNYFSALSNQQYELAKTYCILGGSQYKFVEYAQKERDPTIKITLTPCITKWHWVKAGDAFVDVEIVITSTGIFGISANETTKSLAFLTKISGNWKLK